MRRPRLDFLQAVAGARIQIEIVKTLQLLNSFERSLIEWRLPIESVQNDAFEQVAQRHVVILGEGLKNLEQALFDAHAGLYALNEKFRILVHAYQCTKVSSYAQGEQACLRIIYTVSASHPYESFRFYRHQR